MPDPFRGTIPDDRLYDQKYDMWVRFLDDGRVTVGATAFGLHLAGEIIMFTGKPRGAEVARGRGIGTVETGKTVLALHAPVSLSGLHCNDSAEENPALINRDPYGAGWLAIGDPTDWSGEATLLVDATTYRQRILAFDPAATFSTEQ